MTNFMFSVASYHSSWNCYCGDITLLLHMCILSKHSFEKQNDYKKSSNET